jgi:hypothetical protein
MSTGAFRFLRLHIREESMCLCAGGITRDVSDSVVAVFIEEGAHHLDLMFPHPDDPPSVINARLLEAAHIKKWVQEYTARLRLQKPLQFS